MPTKRDYYEILGVSKTAGTDEIKKAYRNLALQFHPDRVTADKKKEAEERFKEISEAYAVLSDVDKRKLYDQYGHAGIDGRYTSEDIFKNADFSGVEDVFRSGGFEDVFGDIFNMFGGGGGGQHFSGRRSRTSAPTRGVDLEYHLTITLEEAYRGCEKTVSLYHTQVCQVCRGDGAKPGTSKKTCPTCKGHGVVMYSRGFFSLQQTCSKCGGSGETISTPCPECSGRGKVKKESTLTVKIPPGVDTGSTIRVRGKGEAGERGGPSGDLYIVIKVLDHKLFERRKDDLYVEVQVGIATAALGGEIVVPTLDGHHISMKIPSGTPSNKIFRLKDKGMPSVHTGSPGDEYVKAVIVPPESMTNRQKELLKEFAQISGESVEGGFFRKIFK
jgi:molecular chaperone DnaJ